MEQQHKSEEMESAKHLNEEIVDVLEQNKLGVRYFNGDGVVKDRKEAVEWFLKAAEQGLPEAQNNLGLCYLHGCGITQDEIEAEKWFRKAAEQGYPFAQFNLGDCYYIATNPLFGLTTRIASGVNKDNVEAVKWFRKAAEQGLSEARRRLFSCYCDGDGVNKDETEALKCFTMSTGDIAVEKSSQIVICIAEELLESLARLEEKCKDKTDQNKPHDTENNVVGT